MVDKEGLDITGQFTPVLKYLFLLILLHTEKNGKGIAGIRLDEQLWSDKSEKSARNNRNVSVRKLRILLERVGNIRVICNNNFWKIEMGEDVFCDYIKVRHLMEEIQNVQTKDKNKFLHLLELLFYGPLLPNTETGWLDNFKGDYSSAAIDLLHEFLHSEDWADDTKLQLQIANTIFSHDIINEEALAIKCRILFKNGKNALVKKTYEKFSREYEALLGIPYEISLTTLLGDM